jgi:hypothetical protein
MVECQSRNQSLSLSLSLFPPPNLPSTNHINTQEAIRLGREPSDFQLQDNEKIDVLLSYSAYGTLL